MGGSTMRKGYIRRNDSYDIPYRCEGNIDDEKLVLAVHGFASSKESPTVEMLMDALPERGIAVAAFDFPAHGESPADGDMLNVENCLRDLEDVDAFVRKSFPSAEICYFGSSFGAYITMLYLTENGRKGTRAFFRSAAVNMSDYFSELSDDEQKALADEGYFTLADDVWPIKITNELVESLRRNDPRKSFDRRGLELKMIHGSSDEDIAYDAAREFAEMYAIPLITVDGGDHRLSIPGAPERVLEEALKLFEGEARS